MQKTRLKVYIKGKIKPLFVADIYDDVNKTIDDFYGQLNDTSTVIVKFGQLAFDKKLFHHYEIKNK